MKLNNIDFETYFKYYPDKNGFFALYLSLNLNFLKDLTQ